MDFNVVKGIYNVLKHALPIGNAVVSVFPTPGIAVQGTPCNLVVTLLR